MIKWDFWRDSLLIWQDMFTLNEDAAMCPTYFLVTACRAISARTELLLVGAQHHWLLCHTGTAEATVGPPQRQAVLALGQLKWRFCSALRIISELLSPACVCAVCWLMCVWCVAVSGLGHPRPTQD